MSLAHNRRHAGLLRAIILSSQDAAAHPWSALRSHDTSLRPSVQVHSRRCAVGRLGFTRCSALRFPPGCGRVSYPRPAHSTACVQGRSGNNHTLLRGKGRMTRSNALLSVVWLAIGVCVALGCASAPIQKVYQKELSQLRPGMPLAEFQKAMPKAYVAGQNMVAGKRIDAYEVQAASDNYYNPQRLWFYFGDERLIKWGEPGAWPAEADVIVEWRNR